jgi:hypothetical protein
MLMKRFAQLLEPSPIGAVATALTGLLLVGFNAWSYIEYRQFFYDDLFGVGSLKTTLLQTPDHLTLLRHAILGNGNSTYYVLLGLAGILVGVTTYVIIGSVMRAKEAATDIALEMHRPERAFHASANQALLRLAVRSASLVGWALYIVLWLNLLMPYCTLLLENAIDSVVAHEAVGYIPILVSYVLITISLHLHIIFLRLCFLRPRLF